jgi:hypothetical protein
MRIGSAGTAQIHRYLLWHIHCGIKPMAGNKYAWEGGNDNGGKDKRKRN